MTAPSDPSKADAGGANRSPDWAAWQAEYTAREASNLIRPEGAGFVDLSVRTFACPSDQALTIAAWDQS